jgi:hypothetical protein
MSNIAILPFANFSLDPNDAYFADGITDEIISAVAGISGQRHLTNLRDRLQGNEKEGRGDRKRAQGGFDTRGDVQEGRE